MDDDSGQTGELLNLIAMRWQVPGYVLEEFVGFDSFGDIWRGRCAASGRVVALHRLRGAGDRRRAIDRFERTVRSVAHPHLAELYDVRAVGDDIVVVTEHFPGGSLAAVLEGRSLTLGELITVVVPIASALQHVHDHGLVHGDVVGEHVAFTSDGRPVLTGLSIRDLVGDAGESDFRGIGPSADVYGLAALAYRCLAGGRDLAAPDDGAVTPYADLPEELVAAIERALSSQPAERGSVTDLGAAARAAGTPEPVRLPAATAVDSNPAAADANFDGAWRQRLLDRDQQGARRRGRHAAANRRSRLGDGRMRLRRISATVRRSRSGSAVMAGLVLVFVVAAVVWVGAWWSGPSTPPMSAGRSPVDVQASAESSSVATDKIALATEAPPPHPAADGVGPVVDPVDDHWSAIVQDLYDARAKAFGTADAGPLHTVYVDGSPQLKSDLEAIESLADDGRSLSGFQLVVASTEVIVSNADEVELRVIDSYGPFDVVCRGEVVASDPGRPPAEVSTVLRRTGAGWRIVTARLLA